MSENTDVVIRYFDALSHRRIYAAVALLHQEADFRTPIGRHTGRDVVSTFLVHYDRAFPDADYHLQHVFEDGSVVVEGVMRATHEGPLMLPEGGTLPSTGRSVEMPFAAVLELDGGLIRSYRPYWDLANVRAQLGR